MWPHLGTEGKYKSFLTLPTTHMIEVLDAISAARCDLRRTSRKVKSVRIRWSSLDAGTVVVVPVGQVVVSQALAGAHVD